MRHDAQEHVRCGGLLCLPVARNICRMKPVRYLLTERPDAHRASIADLDYLFFHEHIDTVLNVNLHSITTACIWPAITDTLYTPWPGANTT
jgi:hypothetical protein